MNEMVLFEPDDLVNVIIMTSSFQKATRVPNVFNDAKRVRNLRYQNFYYLNIRGENLDVILGLIFLWAHLGHLQSK